MTIILTKPVRVGGVELAAATTQTFAADVEADLVARGSAAYTINPTIGQGGVPVMADINNFTGGIDLVTPLGTISIDDLTVLATPTAPTVLPVDYLHNVKLLAQDSRFLFGVSAGTPKQISRFARGTYAETVVSMSPTSTFPNSPAADGTTLMSSAISTIVRQDENTLWVTVSASTANAILYKVVTTDGWATCTYSPSLYLGADLPNTGVGGNAAAMVSYSFLSPSSMAIDSNGDIYVVEYQTVSGSGAAGERIRLLKLASGSSTWQVIWTLNNGAALQTRHFHCCQIDPYTGKLWISTGDNDAYAGGDYTARKDYSWTLAWDKTGTLPDGATYTTSATMVAALLASPHVSLLHGAQRHRNVQFLFRSDAVYCQSDADPYQLLANQNGGIYKVNHACTTMERVFAQPMEDQMISGYFAVDTGSSLVFFPASGDVAEFTTHSIPIVTTRDCIDFAIAGVVRKVTDSTALPYGAMYDSVSGYCFVAYSSLAGKGTPGGYQTLVFRVLETTPHNKRALDGTKIIRDPEVLHPVYWVDVANSTGAASDAAAPAGYSPRTPWLTTTYALQSSRMTHGGRLKFIDTALTIAATVSTCNWSANANASDASLPLEVDTRGTAMLFALNNAWIKWTAATQHVKVMGDDLRFNGGESGTKAGSSFAIVDTSGASAACNVTFYECRGGYTGLDINGSGGGRWAYVGAGIINWTRCRGFMSSTGQIVQNNGAVSPGNTFQIYDCAFDEMANFCTDNRTDSVYDLRNSYVQVRTQFVNYAAGSAVNLDSFKGRDSAVITCSTTAGALLFTGTNRPASFTYEPFQNCALNITYTTTLDGKTVTNPDFWSTNYKDSLPNMGAQTNYKPYDPAKGVWSDERFRKIGPRVLLLSDTWISGHAGT